MQITIVPDDNIVIVNGMAHIVDCSSLPSTIHAVQWDDGRGWIEFKEINGIRAPNQKITVMTAFQAVLDLWNAEHAKPPPLPPHLRPEVIVQQSYQASKMRKASKMLAKGDTVGAVKLILNRR